MKTTLFFLIGIATLLGMTLSQAAPIYEENFNVPPFIAGDLNGQEGWAAVSGRNSPVVTTATFAGNASGKLANSSVNTFTDSMSSDAAALGASLAGVTSGTFTFEIARGSGNNPITGVALADSSAGGVGFGNANQSFLWKPGLTATSTTLTNSAGSSFLMGNAVWYRLEANLDFSTNTITSVFVTNLSTSAITQLYFGAGNATQTWTGDESTWSRVLVRTGISTENSAYIDNHECPVISSTATIG